MAAKKRDWRAEQVKRNKAAQALGYKNRYQLRKAVERGDIAPLNPRRVKSARTRAAQVERVKRLSRGYEGDLYGSMVRKIMFGMTSEEQCLTWSSLYARHESAKYKPEQRPKSMSRKEYTAAYYDAWVNGDDRYQAVRRKGGSEKLRRWLVDIEGYLTASEYETRYE